MCAPSFLVCACLTTCVCTSALLEGTLLHSKLEGTTSYKIALSNSVMRTSSIYIAPQRKRLKVVYKHPRFGLSVWNGLKLVLQLQDDQNCQLLFQSRLNYFFSRGWECLSVGFLKRCYINSRHQ